MELPAGERTFVHFAIRVMSIVTLLYSAAIIVSTCANFIQNGYQASFWRFATSSWETQLFIRFGLSCVAIVACVGLFQWKSWGRTLLLIWSALSPLLSFVYTLVFLFSYSASITRSTTRPTAPGDREFMIWYSLGGWIQQSAFPAIIFLLLLHRDIAGLWSRRARSGFDVMQAIPAIAITPSTSSETIQSASQSQRPL